MNINDETLWVTTPNISAVRTRDGVALLDFERDMYCDLAFLSGAVWLLINWTPPGISAKDIAVLLEQAVSLPRHILETETCKVVADLTRDGFIQKRLAPEFSSHDENSHGSVNGEGIQMQGSPLDTPGWSISPGVRCCHVIDGSVLLDVKDGRCFSLNGIGPLLLMAMERTSAAISFEEILNDLESRFTVPREGLERAVTRCLGDLKLAGLVREQIAEGQESCLHQVYPTPPVAAMVLESGQNDGMAIGGDTPSVQRIETFESFVDQIFPQGVENNLNWRIRKLKEFIDDAPGQVNGGLGRVCNQLQLSLSDRQARRLFKRAAGMSMKEYARRRRLVFAAKQLRGTDTSIKAIAIDSGYSTQHGFRKSFYEMFGITPAEFRKFWQRPQIA
jgi:AraC-like DNA-binding protein